MTTMADHGHHQKQIYVYVIHGPRKPEPLWNTLQLQQSNSNICAWMLLQSTLPRKGRNSNASENIEWLVLSSSYG